MQIMEADEVDILAFTVPRDLQQIGEAGESGFSRESRRNLRKLDRLDGVDLDLAFVHTVTGAGPNARTTPNANAAGNLSPTDSFAKTFGEDHAKSLHPSERLLTLEMGFAENGRRAAIPELPRAQPSKWDPAVLDQDGHRADPCRGAQLSRSPQPGVFRPGLLENRDVGLGVRADWVRAHDPAMIENLVKHDGCLRISAFGKESFAAHVGRVQTAKIKTEIKTIRRQSYRRAIFEALHGIRRLARPQCS
jgi:hypothetical protein